MNIIFFTQDDPFFVKIFFDEFFKLHKPIEEIKAIVISSPLGKKNTMKLARQMYSFCGFIDFLRIGMKYAFIKVASKNCLEKSIPVNISKRYSLKQLARAYGIDVFERNDLNSQSCRELLQQYDPDLLISIAAPIIFKEDLIKLPRLDCINVHNAPLPNYKGMLPSFWQLYYGEKNSGITVHKIDKGIDTGDIIRQESIPIDDHETLHDLIVKTKKMGAKIIQEVIEDFRVGKINYTRMKGKGSYFTFPTRKDVLEFRKRGRKLL
jgi:methionyl-tRNA formyltransferase